MSRDTRCSKWIADGHAASEVETVSNDERLQARQGALFRGREFEPCHTGRCRKLAHNSLLGQT